jgi:type II restriction/modification system DNA methylase subunit YeeA
MNEIVKVRTILTYFLNKQLIDYELKRETIENSLYGVDIEPSAVEITKLRFWLSLIVDEEDMNNIKPLPNLENRIMCGNSLIEEFEGIKLYIDPQEIREKTETQATLDQTIEKKVKKSEQKLKELRAKQKEFFDAKNRTQKNKLKEEIDKIEWEFIEETLREQGDGENMQKLEQYKKNKSKPFFLWKLYFSDVFHRDNPGFDVVIANPPYVRDEEIMDLKDSLRNAYSTFTGNSDIYTYFYEKGISILRKRGVLTYISSNKFMRAKYGAKIRNFIKTNSSISEIINFGSLHLFEAITNTLILILKKEIKKENKFFFKDNILNEPIEFKQENLLEEAWSIFDKKTMKIKEKIESSGELLSKWDVKINYGLISGFNEAFVINKGSRESLIQKSANNKEIIKPLIRGRDIGRYCHRLKDIYLIVIPSY